MAGGGTLAGAARGADRVVGGVLAAAAVCLALGVSLPALSVDQLLLFDVRMSILSGLGILLAEGEWALAAVVVVFSLLLPAAKIIATGWLWYRATLGTAGFKRQIRLVELAGKWSMLDVFVAALVVMAVKVSVVSDVAVHPGIYFFAAAVVLSMIAAQRTAALAAKAQEAER